MLTIIIVGGGLAGQMAAIKVAEAGGQVLMLSLVPVKRSHSVCAQGGINGAVNTKGEGDSTWEHFDDTVFGGDFLGNQPPIKAMCDAAPDMIYLLDRMGVTFNRTPEGLLDFRHFGGSKYARTAFAGATTGQQLLYALDEQVRRYEVEGNVIKYEGWDFLSLLKDQDGHCQGVIAQNMTTMEIEVFPGDGVILCTGGNGMIFGKSTNSTINTGAAAATAYQQGAYYANGEFIQIHPTAIPAEDKLRLMSESARGDGGRIWTYRDGKPWYFLEEMFPAYGNLVPRDIATRAIYKVCTEMKLGIKGENMVYLDVSHIDNHTLDRKLGGILEIYEKFTGEDPHKVPMKIFPAVHYSMGGLWVDYQHMTNIPGLFAAGECDYQYHGANRLGANSLLSSIYGGIIAGPQAMKYGQGWTGKKMSAAQMESCRQEQVAEYEKLLRMDGKENAFAIHQEMGTTMTDNVTIIRHNDKMRQTYDQLQEFSQRWTKINLGDASRWSNQTVVFVRQLAKMIDLAKVITLGAINRDESRGGHYKPEFPERDDERFLKTTMAQYTPEGPMLSYEEVDTSLLKPRPRRYDVSKEAV
jgi:succinate dehydrogenase / fumarate reductase flavoprotein subunit